MTTFNKNNYDAKEMGRRLKNARTELGMSAPKVAEQIDTSSQSIYFWENGTKFPNSLKLATLCDFYTSNGVLISMDEVIGRCQPTKEHLN